MSKLPVGGKSRLIGVDLVQVEEVRVFRVDHHVEVIRQPRGHFPGVGFDATE